ncbi:MAG: hypothetical protein DMF68_13490 [Acidobacteria bacterium]|nr:MAG: hypothetical protein DMF68_13490 [Acidobacteriota bacterium]
MLAVARLAPAQKENQEDQPFDSFGALKSDDAGARMDNFAIQLQSKPEMDGYSRKRFSTARRESASTLISVTWATS